MLSHNFSLFQCHIYNYNNTYFSTIKSTDFNSTMINYFGNCMVTQHNHDVRVYNFQVHLESDLGAATSVEFLCSS